MVIFRVFYLFVAFMAVTTAAVPADYTIGAKDSLDIIVYDNPDLSGSFSVSETGAINFSLIGELKVVGKTARQIENLIKDKLIAGKYLKSPQVRVSVGQFKSQSVAVLGQVSAPGKFVMEGGSTVLDMLAQAGGLTEQAGDRILLVKRGSGRGEKILTVDMRDINFGDFSKNYAVGGGDVLIIPKNDSFYIYGEVRSPGLYRLERNMTVMQALSVGGGLTNKGTQKGLVISRRDSKGRVTESKVKLQDSIQSNDVIYVKESIF